MKRSKTVSAATDALPAWAGAALVCAVLLVFLWPLVRGTWFIWFDFINQHIPRNGYIAACLARGYLPQWDITAYGGTPFLADPENAVFFPFNWLLILGVARGAMNLLALQRLVVVEVMVAALCMFMALRELGAKTQGAAFGALAWCCSSPFLCRFMNYAHFTVIMCIPAVLWLLFRWARVRTWGAAAAAGVALGIAFLGGNPQYMYFLGLVLALHAACTAAQSIARGTSMRALAMLVAGYVFVFVLACGIAAVNLLPIGQFFASSQRDTGNIAADTGTPFAYVITYLAPHFFGKVTGGGAPYWGHEGFWNYWEYSMYVGIVPLLLGIWGAVSLRGQRERVFLIALVVCAWLYAFGQHNPLPGVLPFGRSLRIPGKFLIFAAFGLCALAGLAFDAAASGVAAMARHRRVWWSALAGGIVVTLCGLGMAFAHAEQSAGLVTAGMLLMITAGVVLYGARVHAVAVPAVLALVMIGDALHHNRAFNAGKDDPRRMYPEIPQLTALRDDMRREHVRMDGRPFTAGNLRALHYGLENMDGFAALVAQNVTEVRGVRGVSEERFNDLWNVKYRFSPQGGFVPRTGYLPRAFVVRNVRAIPAERLIEELSAPAFDARAEALVTAGESRVLGDGAAHANDRIAITAYAPERIELSAEVPQPGVLVVSENALPGWRVTLNGAPAQSLVVNGCFRALELPAGTHQVVWEYRTPGLRAGAAVSAVSVGAAVLVACVSRRGARAAA